MESKSYAKMTDAERRAYRIRMNQLTDAKIIRDQAPALAVRKAASHAVLAAYRNLKDVHGDRAAEVICNQLFGQEKK